MTASIEVLGELRQPLTLVSVDGRHAYLKERRDPEQVVIADVSDPAHPEVVAAARLGPGLELRAVAKGLACAADEAGGLVLFDVADPPNPRRLGLLATDPIEHIHIEGRYAYLVDGASLRIVDLDRPADLVEVGACPLETTGALALAGDTLVIAADSCLRVVDASDRTRPVETGYLALAGCSIGVAAAGDRAYVTDFDAGGVAIVDLARRDRPAELGRFGWWMMKGVTVRGHQLFVAGMTLDAIDVTRPEAPEPLVKFRPPEDEGVWEVAITGDRLYAAGGAAFYVLRMAGLAQSGSGAGAGQ